MIVEILSMMEIKEEVASLGQISDLMLNLASMGRIWKEWALIQAKSSKCSSVVVVEMKVFRDFRVSEVLEEGKREEVQEVKVFQDLEEPEDSKTSAFLDFFN